MKQTLVMTVLAVQAVFSVIVLADEARPLNLGSRVYADETITIEDESETNKGMKVVQKVHLGAGSVVSENKDGTVQFKSDAYPQIEFTLKASSLLRGVNCEFRNRRAHSSEKKRMSVSGGGVRKKIKREMGDGLATEVFKDCTNGIVLFTPDSAPKQVFAVPAGTVRLLAPPNLSASSAADPIPIAK